MRLLAIEMSSRRGSLALLCGEALGERTIETPREQGERVLVHVRELLDEAGTRLDALDGIVFGRGPGSFTGLRLAVAVAQGLAMAGGRGLVGVSSLAAIAQQAYRLEDVTESLVCVDARMGEVYWGRFRVRDGIAESVGGERLDAPEAVEVPDGARWRALGDGFAAYPDLADRAGRPAAGVLADMLPLARDLLPRGSAEVEAARLLSPEAAEPAYLRGKTAWRRDIERQSLTKLQ